MHPALDVPELLDLIFSFSDHKSNTNNVSVCKQWSTCCLDVLWHDLRDLARFLRILGELVDTTGTRRYDFKSLPSTEPGDRFQIYSHRVRSLQVKNIFPYIPALDRLMRAGLHGKLFPNLRSLEWLVGPRIRDKNPTLEYSFLFMGDSLERFKLYLEHDPSQSLSLISYMTIVARRISSLTAFILNTDDWLSVEEEAAIELLIGALPNLQSIAFSVNDLSHPMMKVLSRAPKLRQILHSEERSRPYGDDGDGPALESSWPEDAFPAVTHLELRVVFSEFTAFLQSNQFSCRFTVLSLESDVNETPAHIHSLLLMISTCCPLIMELHLLAHDFRDDNVPPDAVTLHTLDPIFKCHRIKTFEILHALPLALDLEDIKTLACRLPTIEKLNLNCTPGQGSKSELTLLALLPFARNCPHLKSLGLFINACPVDVPSLDQMHPFCSLRELAVGSSPIAGAGSAVLFLSYICPSACQVKVKESKSAEGRVAREHWKEVNRVLPWTIMMRKDVVAHHDASVAALQQ